MFEKINNLKLLIMKRKFTFLSIFLFICMLISCDNSDNIENSYKQNSAVNKKNDNKSQSQNLSTSLDNFKMAINEMNKPKYFPSEEYSKQYGNELSPERKNILFKPAMDLIYTVEHKDIDNVKTMADTNNVLNKAFKIYTTQTSKKQ